MVAVAPARSSSPFVLLVDDDVDSCDMYSLYLHHAGFRVAQAHDGIEGFDAAVASRPDVIVTDVAMPRVDGLELCQRLRREAVTCDIPIVTVTARVDRVADVQCLHEAGVEVVLLKPCEPARLLAEIRRILEKSRKLRARATEVCARADAVHGRALDLTERTRVRRDRWRSRVDRRAIEIAERIRGEFREMPGLHLTLAQAARLWDVDRETCQRILDNLVGEQFLAVRTGRYFMTGRR
jgi:DNA-binding response OmpR family regulator